MNATFDKRTPIYLQVLQDIKRQIIYDEVKAGEELPSRRQLAQELKINPNTVQRAFKEMEDQGLIYTEPNRPSRVTDDPARLQQLKKEWVNQKIADFVADISPLNLPNQEIIQLIQENMEQRKKENK